MRQGTTWQHHIFYRKESIKTTWKVRLAVLLLVALLWHVSRGFWIERIGQGLVCAEELARSDVILVENFDPNYLLFERAAALQKSGFAARVLVPTEASGDPKIANLVSRGIVELMTMVARIQEPEIIPITEKEPISLNAAYQIRDFLTRRHLRSVIIVIPGFRSRRSCLVYHAAMDHVGIKVYCVPVFGQQTPTNWTESWHGIQGVFEQFLKLQYYRFFVLPLSLRRQPGNQSGTTEPRLDSHGALQLRRIMAKPHHLSS